MEKESKAFKSLWWGIWLVFLATPLLEHVTALGFLIAVISFIIILCGPHRKILKPHLSTSLEIPLALLFIAAIISFFPAFNKASALEAIIVLIIAYSLFYLIAVYLSYRPDRVKKIADLILFTFSVVVIFGLLQYIKNILPDTSYLKEILSLLPYKPDKHFMVFDGPDGTLIYKARLTSIFLFPNSFASFLVLGLPVFFGILLAAKNKLPLKIPLFIIGFMGIFCLFQTYSRTAWVVIVFSLLFMFFLAFNKKYRIIMVILISGALILTSIYLFFNFEKVKPYIFRPFSDNSRIVIWTNSVDMFLDHPLTGIGIANFYYVYPDYLSKEEEGPNIENRPWHAHNIVLNLAVEIGILGLIAFLWFIGKIVYRLYTCRGRIINRKWLSCGIISALTGFFCYNLIDFVLDNIKSALYFFVILGFAWGVIALVNKDDDSSSEDVTEGDVKND